MSNNIFARRLKSVLSASGVGRGELARHLDVSVPTVNRWLNGISTPNAYQLREIVHYFGTPYDWFLEDKGGVPDAGNLAVKLGLSEDTVDCLLVLAEDADENKAVLEAVDLATRAALAVADAVWEDLDRYAEKAVEQAKRRRGVTE